MDLLCLALGGMLQGKVPDFSASVSSEIYEKAMRYADANKLQCLFLRATQSLNVDGLQVSERNAIATKHVAKNAYILHLITSVSDILSAEKIAHIFFKGPLQQKLLYGDFFSKPSADADILVLRENYAEARTLLVESGFILPSNFKNLWWQEFLGEQPLFRDGFMKPSLDLHHRLQQPGSPAPRKLYRFLDNMTSVKLGTREVPTANLVSIVLIAAMNLVKAVYHREPGGAHALDIQAALHMMTPVELSELRSEARLQGLQNTVAFSSRASATIFFLSDLYSDGNLDLPIPETELAGLILAPEENSQYFPQRRRMLAHLCDQVFPEVPIEAVRWLLSEGARRVAK